MRLDKEIFNLSHRATGIFYHPENDAVLLCAIPTDNQLDGFDEDWDELVIEVTDDEIESWNILYTFSTAEWERITKKLEVLKNASKK